MIRVWPRGRPLGACLCCVVVCLVSATAHAGPYAPAAGQTGSTAISRNAGSFSGWASGATIDRGPIDISDADAVDASFGAASDATGKPEGNSNDVVSLGDGGTATLTFDKPITDGDGADFAVFENSFGDTFLELAFVEVSSDGSNFFRFDAVSKTQTSTQVGSFGTVDPTDLYNFAGKYRQGYGTPFDLSELSGTAGLNTNRITHVKLVDVVGSLNASYATYDSNGNKVNDPWPTQFSSGGFDLDGAGAIHVTPEPGTAVLLGLGLVSVFGRVRRRRA